MLPDIFNDAQTRFYVLLITTFIGTGVNAWLNNTSRRRIQELEIRIAVCEAKWNILSKQFGLDLEDKDENKQPE